MTATAARRRPSRPPRGVHPVTILRWLRVAMLLSVGAAMAACLLIGPQSRHDIGVINGTTNAAPGKIVAYANTYLNSTQKDLAHEVALATEGKPVPVGTTGDAFTTDFFAANMEVGSTNGTESDVQTIFPDVPSKIIIDLNVVSDELGIYYTLGTSAVDAGKTSAQAARLIEDGAAQMRETIQSHLSDIEMNEAQTQSARRAAWVLNPRIFWGALLGPVIAAALLVAATVRVLARRFRRHASPWLWASLAVTAAVSVTVGVFNLNDERHVPADPWAGHPATLAVAVALYLTAGVLAYLAYRPRLAEYRFLPPREPGAQGDADPIASRRR